MWWKKVMGIINANSINRTENLQQNKNYLEKKDFEFIQAKLQTAEFKGHEFEKFYDIWVKIENHKKELKLRG